MEMVGQLTEAGKSGMEADGYGCIKCMTSLMAGGRAGMSAREMKQAASDEEAGVWTHPWAPGAGNRDRLGENGQGNRGPWQD